MSFNWETLVSNFFAYGLFLYSLVLLFCYIMLAFFSMREITFYLRKNKSTDFKILAPSEHTPHISILAPAFNESATIIENVKSLLTIYYYNLQIVIINDGSKDDSIPKLIEAYELELTDVYIPHLLKTKPIRGVYKSKNPAFNRLLVVDKENGGKADSLNAGVNIASGDIIVCVDVDCILEQDAIFKIVKPFLDQSDTKVIASGGVVRIANSCVVEKGKLVKVVLPKQLLPRLQSLEYIRSFLLGRMAWSRIDGLLLISGAFGAFDKSIVIACGGYNTATVGEDMELVVRMRRYMHERKEKYSVVYIPEPLCWTEAPVSYKVLIRQRNRWTRGTIETLRDHRKLFFNKNYGLLGLLSYPYWFFFEMLAAPIEFFGLMFFLVMAILGEVNWDMFLWLFAFVWTCSFAFSSFAILMESASFNLYKRKGDTLKLLFVAMIEPFVYHPVVVWSAINGFSDYFQDVKTWGVMSRAGFASKASTVPQLSDVNKKETVFPFEKFASYYTVTLGLFIVVRIYEVSKSLMQHNLNGSGWQFLRKILIADLTYLCSTGFVFFILYSVIYQLHKKTADTFVKLFCFLLIFLELLLTQYYLTSLVPLGADLWGYSLAEIKQTVGAAGLVRATVIILLIAVIVGIISAIQYFPNKIKYSRLGSRIFVGLTLLVFIAKSPIRENNRALRSEYDENLSINKSHFLYKNSINYFFPNKKTGTIYDDQYSGDFGSSNDTSLVKNNFISADYPFLHHVDTSIDVLSPFLNKATVKPNIVIILVEGLGRAFTNSGAYLGNFTPYLDSLSKQSLYWSNFMSEGGRTFAVLPSVLGSLPFGKNGFAEMGTDMPNHLSLLSVLKKNGYQTNFYYGGDAYFDYMDVYLKKAGIGSVNDIKSFNADYTKMPASAAGFSWGYGDQELFRKYLADKNQNSKAPYCNVLLTVSTHSPFLINDQKIWLEAFEKRMNELEFSESKKKSYRNFQQQYASILFLDQAVRNFINAYRNRPDFANTVFVITGDHRMPEIPMNTKIDRYHVPLMIYSPLLKRSATINSISTHFDITPSLLQWLQKTYGLEVPNIATWMGIGLDTVRAFRNLRSYPFMQTKNEVNHFIRGKFFVEGGSVYSINEKFDLDIAEAPEDRIPVLSAFEEFKNKNASIQKGNKLLPDSIILRFRSKE